jgi:hypothetical protein
MVRTHPETGKKILFVNWTYTKQIIGFNKEESDQLLKEIFEHQAKLDLTGQKIQLLSGITEVLFIMLLLIFFLVEVWDTKE